MDTQNFPARRSPPLWSLALSSALVAAGFRRREASGPPQHDDRRTQADAPERGWFEVARRVYERFSEDRVMSIAGGVTFFVLLAIFPAIAALVSIYGLFADPASLNGQVDQLSGVLPSGAIDIVGDQMRRVASQGGTALGITFLVSLAVSLWSANSGMKAMFDALNIVYDEKEKRGFFRLNAISLVFTFLGIAFILLAFAAVVVLPIVVNYLGLQSALDLALRYGRWPLLFVAIALALAVIYRFGPSRQNVKWRWITSGSAAAALLWLAASALFSWYAANFGNFDRTYGTLGAAIGFMMWLWISAIVILMGAELDAELEWQDPLPGEPVGREPAPKNVRP
jgi:membrane protein